MSNWLKIWGSQITLSIADHKTVRHPKAPEAAAADTSRALKRPGLSELIDFPVAMYDDSATPASARHEQSQGPAPHHHEHRTKATIPSGRMAGIKAPMLNTMYSYLHDNWTLNVLCV
ncbi:hypothetical protein AaE_015689 [Aphanomyces astaci]|uniref:Uncharacterized protein n=1 Tax=Aphanomyces astaci TaxID=112090 RepID=A0A6A4Z6M1_APHAT|nr:hypothetical protein AaE_015689 [Aphanomyces astaci]